MNIPKSIFFFESFWLIKKLFSSSYTQSNSNFVKKLLGIEAPLSIKLFINMSVSGIK